MTAGIILGVGIAFDLLGIALVAAADWWPDAVETKNAVGRSYAAMKAELLSALRREHHSGGVAIGTAVDINTAGNITPKKGPRPPGSADERLARLEQESRQAMERLGKLEGDLRELPDAWRRDIASTRGQLAELIDRRLTETDERYRRARQLGVACLIVGLTLTAASNAF